MKCFKLGHLLVERLKLLKIAISFIDYDYIFRFISIL